MRRSHIPVALLIGSLLLAGCATPAPTNPSRDDDEEENDTAEVALLTADDLEGFFDPADTLEAFGLGLDFKTSDWPEWVAKISDFWNGASRTTDNACFDIFVAQYLIGDNNDDDVHVEIADESSIETSRYVGVEARVFASPEDAESFLELVTVAAEKCSTVGGYNLYDGDVQVWGVTGITATHGEGLTLPRDVQVVVVDEQVDPAFAVGAREVMLQYRNVVVSATVQADEGAEFTVADADEFAELLALRLSEVD
jgi:hypothetical protein